jgi:hypothetical protein
MMIVFPVTAATESSVSSCCSYWWRRRASGNEEYGFYSFFAGATEFLADMCNVVVAFGRDSVLVRILMTRVNVNIRKKRSSVWVKVSVTTTVVGVLPVVGRVGGGHGLRRFAYRGELIRRAMMQIAVFVAVLQGWLLAQAATVVLVDELQSQMKLLTTKAK